MLEQHKAGPSRSKVNEIPTLTASYTLYDIEVVGEFSDR